MRADVQRPSNEMLKGMWHLDDTFPGCEERQGYRILDLVPEASIFDRSGSGVSCCVQELGLAEI